MHMGNHKWQRHGLTRKQVLLIQKNTIDIVLKILRIKTVQGVLGNGAQPPVLDIWGHRFLEERRLA